MVDGSEIGDANVATGSEVIGGVDAVGSVRVQAVRRIDPNPIINLKYFTLN